MCTLEIRPIKEGIWNFVEVQAMGNNPQQRHEIDAYLICGQNRAIMFDTLQSVRGLYEKVRELTSLPIDVVISHGHGDHYGAATGEFLSAGCPVYLNHGDWPLLTQPDGQPFPAGHFQELEDGQVFDLGGRVLTAMLMPGHTPAGDVLLDQAEGLVFTGDAIGSGHFWMQLPTSVTIEELLPAVEKLAAQIKAWGKDVLILAGHRYQSPVPLTFGYVEDVLHLLRGLLDGTLQGETMSMDLHGRHIDCCTIAHGGMLGMLYDPQKIHRA